MIEATKNSIIQKSKASNKGKQRFNRRLKSKVANQVKQFNDINMDKLFKEDILDIGLSVRGETNNYIVKISFSGLLEEIRKKVEKLNKIDIGIILNCLIKCFTSNDVYMHCSCLHPDTKIRLLSGEVITVKEMEARHANGEKMYVYSADSNGDFKPGEVEKVWITGYESDLIKVTLDNGESIITTPNHPYMLRNGSYCIADHLEVGQSLMPMYMSNTANGYDTVKLNSTNVYHSVYKLIAEEFYEEAIKLAKEKALQDKISGVDKMKYDVAIHHKDFNKHNNNPDNLQVMTGYDHWLYHANTVSRLWDDPEFRAASSLRASEHMKALNANPTQKLIDARNSFMEKGHDYWRTDEGRAIKSISMKDTMTNYYANRTEEEKQRDFEKRSKASKQAWLDGKFNTEKWKAANEVRKTSFHSKEMEELAHQGLLKYWENISDEDRAKRAIICKENRQRGVYSQIEKQLKKLIELKLDLTEENYDKIRYRGCPKITKKFKNIDEAVEHFGLNHKITSIEHIHLDEAIPVYDIKVKDWENFTVDAGVVLHNCPDWRFRFDYLAREKHKTNSTDNPDDPQNRAPVKTNPDDALGSGCKHTLLVLSNRSWLIKVASVINNYIIYMQKHYEKQYADIIYPVLFGKKYEEPVQLSIDDIDNTDGLGTSTDIIDKSNEYGRTRTQFQKGNTQGIRFASSEKENPDQMNLNI